MHPAAFTIAIPTYNRAAKLRKLLEAIRAQALPDDELLVADDASTDNTADIVQQMPPFKLIRNFTNLGMVGNWNMCLRTASRDWICLVHDDDELAPDGLKWLRYACEIVGAPALIAHRAVGADFDSAFRYRVCEPGPWAAWNCPTIPSGTVIHRTVIETLGMFDPRFSYSADLEYFGRIAAKFKSVIIESPTVLYYRLHNTNHQFDTWRQPDFYRQYLELHRTVLQHCGLTGTKADKLLQQRVRAEVRGMLKQACRLKDRQLIRSICRKLLTLKFISLRRRLVAVVGAVTGWVPAI